MRVLLLIFFALLSVSGVGAQEDLPPYIHYFDHLRGGLVIERADGTDSRMIPDVPMGNIEWSPSGKWMVFGSSLIVRSDDGLRMPVPQPLNRHPDDRYALWSPTDDLLFTVYRDLATHLIRMQVFDVDTNTIVTEFTYREMFSDIQGPSLYWAPNGEAAYVAWNGKVVTLSINGKTELYADEFNQFFDQFFEFESAFHQGRRLTFSLQVREVNVLTIEDLQTGSRIEVNDTTPERQARAYQIRWSPTLNHALIYARPCSGEACESWLKLLSWETGTAQSLTPTIELDAGCYDHTCIELWSPDGQYAVLTDKEGAVHLLDAETGEFRQIAKDKTVIDYQWSPESQLFLNYEDETTLYEQMHIYDPATDHVRDVELPVGALQHGASRLSSFYPSSDERYIALRSGPPTVIDQTGGIVTQTINHSHSTWSYPFPDAYLWHSSSEWVMAEYSISISDSGGVGPLAAVLFDLAGTTRRELPTRGYANFVPDHVIPHLAQGQSTSVKKDPTFQITQRGLVENVGWHPTDPDRFVTYSYEEGFVFWSLASGEPQITDQFMPLVSLPTTHPYRSVLHWLPEQNIVAYQDHAGLQLLDIESGEILLAELIAHPVWIATRDTVGIQFPLTGESVQLDRTLALSDDAWLTSDMEGFIVGPNTYKRLNESYYVDAETGRAVLLDIPRYPPYSSDARGEVAFGGAVYDCCIAVLSTEDGHLIDQFYGTAVSLAISADGRRLATTSTGMTAIWDISEYLPTD